MSLTTLRTFKSSPSSFKTGDTPQRQQKLARNSALTDAGNQNSIARSADPWTEVVQKETGQVYYWNKQTSKPELVSLVLTVLALTRRSHASALRDFNTLLPFTDETTALGEPKPGPEGRRPVQQVVVGRGTSLLGLVGVGAGVGLAFALIGRLLGG